MLEVLEIPSSLPIHLWPSKLVVVVQLPSHVKLCNPADCSIPGFPVLHHLPEFAQLSNIFLSLLNLSNFLCLWSPFHRLQDDSSFYFCCLPPGKWGSSRGLYRLLGEKEWCLCSSWWSWILFPVMSWTALDGMFWGFCELRKTLGCLSADGWGCVPILLVVWHEVARTGTCRQLTGARSWCWDGYAGRGHAG